MRFNFFAIARHGHSLNKDLSSEGLGQAQNLADTFVLNYGLEGDSLLVLSSPAMRAYRTAKIISKGINEETINRKKKKKGVRLEIFDELWDDTDSPLHINKRGDIGRIYDRSTGFLDSTGRDSMIMVAHNPMTRMIPKYLTREISGQNLSFADLGFGEAYAIDFRLPNPEWKHIPCGKVQYRSKMVFY